MSGLKGWRDLPAGGVITEAGNSAAYETGTWRTWIPVWKSDNCIHCLTCWVFCPEEAYMLTEGETASGKKRKEIKEINYFHCKGCGLCVKECPVNKKGKKQAIELIHDHS
jgi:pyruvate ferredoxin oxidoreductase delta subunit